MKVLSKSTILFLMLFVSLSSQAQSGRPENKDTEGVRPFISVQGGATRSFLQDGVDRKWAPMGAVSLGAYFTPAVGARLQADGWQWKQFNNVVGYNYKSRFIGGNADLLLNLSNFVNPNYNKVVNVVLLGGFGLQYATTKYSASIPTMQMMEMQQMMEMNEMMVTRETSVNTKKNERLSPNLRFGGQLDLQFIHNVSLLLEGGGQMVLDNYGRSGTTGKVWPYAMAGLAVKLGKKKAVVAPVATPIIQEVVDGGDANSAAARPSLAEQKPQPKPQPKPIVKPAPAKNTENVFFSLCQYEVKAEQQAVINRIAKWAQEHPSAQIVLTGYADKGTGTPAVNKKYSERRTASVKDALVKLGIAEERIIAEALGDTVQPFAENDQNRVVIVLAEEK